MIEKTFKKIISKFITKRKLLNYLLDDVDKELIYSLKKKYLTETGWVNSFRGKKPVAENKKPIPWMSLPFIDFIDPRLNKNLSIFEYGSGNSSLYLASKVNEVYAVEHDLEWYNSIKNEVKQFNNVHLLYEELEYGGNYSKKANDLDKKFDIIIVDGRDRVNCCLNSIHSLSEEGVIILDDSERDEYADALNFFKNFGMRKIDFWGIAPGLSYRKATSIFYRQKNCLNL